MPSHVSAAAPQASMNTTTHAAALGRRSRLSPGRRSCHAARGVCRRRLPQRGHHLRLLQALSEEGTGR